MTKFHIVGIGGMGMSAVARLLLARGDRVSGSDKGSWPLAQALAADGATVATAFAAENVTGADVVVRSSAYGDTNPEIAAARAAATSGLLSPYALDRTTTSAPVTCPASNSVATSAPSAARAWASGHEPLSDPLTTSPRAMSSRATADMPMPPIPTI